LTALKQILTINKEKAISDTGRDILFGCPRGHPKRVFQAVDDARVDICDPEVNVNEPEVQVDGPEVIGDDLEVKVNGPADQEDASEVIVDDPDIKTV